VSVQGEAVDAEREGEQVQVLAGVTDRVRTPQPQGVIEGPVDRLGIVATPVQPIEVRICCWDRSDVLGPVELASNVVFGRVQPHRDDAAAEIVGELVVVVPTEPAVLVLIAMGTHPSQLDEVLLAGVGQGGDARSLRRRQTNPQSSW
jgi:hypothetical protein